MRRVLGLVVLAAVLVGCTSAPSAPPGTAVGSGGTSTPAGVASADPAKAADVRDIIRTAMDTYKLKAVIVRVTIDGKDVITEAFGNSMTGVPASTDMHFRNGSVAESYIANLLLQLVEQKKISLDDKLSTGCPTCPTPARSRLATSSA